MGIKDWDKVISELMEVKNQTEIEGVMYCNERSSKYGLSLTKEEALALIDSRGKSLKQEMRIEVGTSILDKLIDTFCDSQYIYQDIYLESLEKLLGIFYAFKNESQDKVNDDELLEIMREQFEYICMGDLDYLEGTCLERFTRAVRAGYRGYEQTGGRGEYNNFSEEARWDYKLYLAALREAAWE